MGMKKFISIMISCLFAFLMLGGCGSMSKTNDSIKFNDKNLLSNSYFGSGVEFDVYEAPSRIIDMDKVYNRLDKLNPSMIRCMINYEWFTENLSEDGTSWDYNWSGDCIQNLFAILDHCEEKGIDVAIGPWRARDGWFDKTSDSRWADMTLALFQKFEEKGYTCVKYFVPTNEPNYIDGNTQAIWEEGVKNVYAKFKENGLAEKYKILGTDVSGFSAAVNWSNSLSSDVVSKLGSYSIHTYVSNNKIDSGKYQSSIEEVVDALKKKDSDFSNKGLVIWECGLQDGTNDDMTESEIIDTYDYGVRMTDLTIQAMLGGVNGICYWELDDAAHFRSNGMNTVWGMFSSLGDTYNRTLRPWYQSSMLTLNILQKGNKVYGYGEDSFRALASVSQDGAKAGLICINRNKNEVTKTMKIEGASSGEKLYCYFFNQDNAMLDETGFIMPNKVVDGNLDAGVSVTIPANCVLFVTNERI